MCLVSWYVCLSLPDVKPLPQSLRLSIISSFLSQTHMFCLPAHMSALVAFACVYFRAWMRRTLHTPESTTRVYVLHTLSDLQSLLAASLTKGPGVLALSAFARPHKISLITTPRLSLSASPTRASWYDQHQFAHLLS